MNVPGSPPPVRRGPSRWKLLFWLLLVPVALASAYFFFVLKWNYSTGERAGWVQKFSHKGWLCKTWEGELALVTMPGASPEKFYFTVWDGATADAINKVMGKRVSVYYEEKVGLPSTCFGDTRYFVKRVAVVDEIPMLAPGIAGPTAPAQPVAPVNPAPAAQPTFQQPSMAAPSPAAAPPATK